MTGLPSRCVPFAALAASLALSACGGGGDSKKPAANPKTTSTKQQQKGAPANKANPAEVKVIRGWVDAHRKGDTEKAASYFALPSMVSNGTGPIRLATREQVRAFNAQLPCGAVLTRAYDAGAYTVATFRLTNRPGADCGSGLGGRASTAFEIRSGKIALWLRVPDELADQGAAPGTPSEPDGPRPAPGSVQAA